MASQRSKNLVVCWLTPSPETAKCQAFVKEVDRFRREEEKDSSYSLLSSLCCLALCQCIQLWFSKEFVSPVMNVNGRLSIFVCVMRCSLPLCITREKKTLKQKVEFFCLKS